MTHYTIAFYSKAHNEKEFLVNRCEKLMIDKINQKRQEVFQCFFKDSVALFIWYSTPLTDIFISEAISR